MENNRRLFWLAAALPFLFVIALAIRDVASGLWQEKKLGDAAFAGTQWVRANSFDQAAVAVAARSATDQSGVAVTAASPCGCPSGERIFQFKCDAICAAGEAPRRYVVVTTSICLNTVFHWPGVHYCARGDSLCSATGCTPRQVLLSAQSVALQ